MKQFKFFQKKYIALAHDGGYIYAGETFYTMNKEVITRPHPKRESYTTPKYTIVTRFISKKNEDKFRPDYDLLWYFKSKHNADCLKTLWMYSDRIREAGGDIFHNQSDIRITFNR